MSFPWHAEVRREDQERLVEQTTQHVSNHEFFKNNPKYPQENIRQIAYYFIDQAWNSSPSREIFLAELSKIPLLAEKYYSRGQHQQSATTTTPTPTTTTPTTQQEQSQNQQVSTVNSHHHQQQQPTSQQQQQQQQIIPQQHTPVVAANDTQLFWEAFIKITKNRQECDKLKIDYSKAKQVLEKFKEKKSKFLTVREPHDVENRLQQLELIAKNLRQYFSDHHVHYQTHLEKYKNENDALSNLVSKSPIKKGDHEIKVLRGLGTILHNFDSIYETWSMELKNKQTEHVTLLNNLITNEQQYDEIKSKFLCEAVHNLVGFPSCDDFANNGSSPSHQTTSKRTLTDVYQSLQPTKLRKYEEDIFPMKNFMKEILQSTSPHSFYDVLQEKLTTGLVSRFSVTFRNAKSKFEVDIRHFPRAACTNNDVIDEEEQQETFMPSSSQLLSPTTSTSSVSELSCTTNLTDLQNVNTFQSDNAKQFVIEIALFAKLQDETKCGFLQLYLCPPMRIHVNYSQQTGIVDLIEPIVDFTTEGMENPKAKQYSTINTFINAENGRLLLSGPLQLPFIRENVLQSFNQDDSTTTKVQHLLSSYVESALMCIDSVSISGE